MSVIHQTATINMDAAISFNIPIRVVNSSNAREHHQAKARRIKNERSAACLCFKTRVPAAARQTHVPGVVFLCRAGPRLMDDDGNVASLKAVRDEIAKQMGVDDGPHGPLKFEYAQRQDKRYSVDVVLVPGVTR